MEMVNEAADAARHLFRPRIWLHIQSPYGAGLKPAPTLLHCKFRSEICVAPGSVPPLSGHASLPNPKPFYRLRILQLPLRLFQGEAHADAEIHRAPSNWLAEVKLSR
jgi:hypothetical protein